ncbi:MAG: penicillin-binding protein 2 [Candidatus Zixiibacteriota bacterium]
MVRLGASPARELISFGVISLAVVVLTVGLVKLQVVQHRELAEQSENNRLRVQPVIPGRGRVYDRYRQILVDNRPSYTVAVVPADEVPGVTVNNLAKLIDLDTLQIRRRIKKNFVSRYQPAAVKRDVPFEVIAVLEEQSRRFPGVILLMERVRQYVDSRGIGPITGYVGEVNKLERTSSRSADYRLGSLIGKKGIEKQYDYMLRGREGTQYVEVTASGQVLGIYRKKKPNPAVAGADLILTIDIDLQRHAFQVLDTFCCGAVVAMDPRTGELLAMASFPSYDPNIFSSVIPESLWQAITKDSTHPLLNRPLDGLYPPGSTTKLLTLGAALEEGIVTQSTTFKSCAGGYQFGDRFFRCWKSGGHGILNGIHSVEQSCDVYFYQVGLKLGVDGLSHYFDLCGFGRQTGIDLPREADGLNPNSAYYDRRYGKRKWTRGLVLNNAIGQGELLSTPLQLAQFFSGLVNDGLVYRPHLLKRIVRPDGQEQDMEPVVSFRLPFTRETLGILRESMRLVVEGEEGTAKALGNNRFTIGGKTGTAQNPHGDNHAWFVGYAPIEDPQIVVCAILENAGHGAEVAAPLVASIVDRFFVLQSQHQALSMNERTK